MKISSIRTLYFYVISLIGLLMIVIPTVDLVNIALKTWVFPEISLSLLGRLEESYTRARQADAVRDFSFLIVGIPLFWFHFRTAQRERREERYEAKS